MPVDVLLALELLGVVLRAAARQVMPGLAVAVEDLIDERLPVGEQPQRLTHAHVLERARVHAHREALERCAGRFEQLDLPRSFWRRASANGIACITWLWPLSSEFSRADSSVKLEST